MSRPSHAYTAMTKYPGLPLNTQALNLEMSFVTHRVKMPTTMVPDMTTLGTATAPEFTTVKLPDLFQTFLKGLPQLNIHYQDIRHESEEWLNRYATLYG